MSQPISSLLPLFLQNIFYIPQIIIFFVGLRVSMKYRSLNSRHVSFLITAFSIFLATILISIAVQVSAYLLFSGATSGTTDSTYTDILAVKTPLQYIFNIVGWIYILKAIPLGIKEIKHNKA